MPKASIEASRRDTLINLLVTPDEADILRVAAAQVRTSSGSLVYAILQKVTSDLTDFSIVTHSDIEALNDQRLRRRKQSQADALRIHKEIN